MRPTLSKITPRRKSGTGPVSRLARASRSNAAAASGGPVAPTAEYIGRRGRRINSGRSGGSIFPRHRPSTMLRRLVLTMFICASLGLITATYRGGVVLHSAQLAVYDVVAPIERGMSRAWDPIAGAWNWSGRLFSATSEVPKLERENAELREQVRIARNQEDEFVQLQRDLGFMERGQYPNGFDMVAARVTVRPIDVMSKTLTIEGGSNRGIAKDDAVMADGALIGIVTDVTATNAFISLIVDDSIKVSASVSGSEASGVLETVSTEGSPTMQLKYVNISAEVKKDDQLVTSGFDTGNGVVKARYPGGIPIGQVTDVGNNPADVYKTVQVKPYADFDRIDRVYVLVPEARSGA